jgi:hypothetical protein
MTLSPGDDRLRDEALAPGKGLPAALGEARTQHGRSLLELSERQPLLIIFLRHFG